MQVLDVEVAQDHIDGLSRAKKPILPSAFALSVQGSLRDHDRRKDCHRGERQKEIRTFRMGEIIPSKHFLLRDRLISDNPRLGDFQSFRYSSGSGAGEGDPSAPSRRSRWRAENREPRAGVRGANFIIPMGTAISS